jgi:hypothetical protein
MSIAHHDTVDDLLTDGDRRVEEAHPYLGP